jgi:uncharacterized membrane protein
MYDPNQRIIPLKKNNPMTKKTAKSHISQKEFPLTELYSGDSLHGQLLSIIQKEHPDFNEDSYISINELHTYRKQYLDKLLRAEKKELNRMDKEVLESLGEDELLSHKLKHQKLPLPSLGDRIADKVASFGGSWAFIISFFVFLIVWMAVNVVILAVNSSTFDPYPFILLNLILSTLASIQAPVIMMSQNRKEERDRQRAENDYKINLKAELEIRMLHEKIDHLILRQNQRLIDIQEIQSDLLNDILKKLEK